MERLDSDVQSVFDLYHVNFIYDVAGYLQTLDLIETLDGKLFIPAHAEPAEDIRPLAELNRAKVLEICELVLDFCREPVCFEELLQKVFQRYQLDMDFNQYYWWEAPSGLSSPTCTTGVTCSQTFQSADCSGAEPELTQPQKSTGFYCRGRHGISRAARVSVRIARELPTHLLSG